MDLLYAIGSVFLLCLLGGLVAFGWHLLTDGTKVERFFHRLNRFGKDDDEDTTK